VALKLVAQSILKQIQELKEEETAPKQEGASRFDIAQEQG
jgi:hypothetical protein